MTDQKHEQIIPDEMVMSKIYVLREQRVMLDKDLAELFCASQGVAQPAGEAKAEGGISEKR